jgi:hypothetical protein
MPPGDNPAHPIEEEREAALDQLRSWLGALTIADLRAAAKRWRWPLRGTAKADVIEQLVQRLVDVESMQRIVQSLPLEQREVLAWVAVMARDTSTPGRIQAAMNVASGATATLDAVHEFLAGLAEGCLIFDRGYEGYQIPLVYGIWTPQVEAAGMMCRTPPPSTRSITRSELLQQADVLLAAIDSEKPLTQPPLATLYGRESKQRQDDYIPQPNLLAPEFLVRWGFGPTDDLHLARFLLELLINGGLVQLETAANQRAQLKPGPLRSQWDQVDAATRLGYLRAVAMGQAPNPARVFGSWNELNLALPAIRGYTLRIASFGGPVTPAHIAMITNDMRFEVLNLLGSLRLDTWYDLDRFESLHYQTARDAFGPSQRQSAIHLRWYQGNQLVTAKQMGERVWRDTYGQVLRAVVQGPAFWLQLVELGMRGAEVVAVRIPSTVSEGTTPAPPADALGFAENQYVLVRTSHWVGDLRRLALLIAVEAAQRPDVRVFKLDPAALRATLQRGLTVADVAGQFAAAGFPLPGAMLRTLESWQSRAGRHHLYDNVAAIELSDDVLLAEIQAIVHLQGIPIYQASPRCLLLLDPARAPQLTAELARRGYTPKVLP